MVSFGQLVVWLIIGAFSGTYAGRVVTLKREGLGRWTNIAVGMAGAVVGGFLFWLFGINLGLGELKVTFEDLISAFVGSMLCITGWWIFRKVQRSRKKAKHPT